MIYIYIIGIYNLQTFVVQHSKFAKVTTCMPSLAFGDSPQMFHMQRTKSSIVIWLMF